MTENNKLAEFKGTKEGIIVQIKSTENFGDIIDSIRTKLDKSAQFFTGATIIGVEGVIKNEIDRFNLFNVLNNEYKLKVKSLDSFVKEENIIETEEIEEIEENIEINYNEYSTKIIRTTLRSGMSVDYDGNILVIGDVNPGAEVSASGNVIVMGKLRGMVHAGKSGNKDTYIIASKLAPTQIRITDVIARAPEEDNIKELNPEIAFLEDGQMNIKDL